MKNNKGFGRFEVMTLILLMIVVLAGGFYMILNGANKQRMITMRDNASNFSKMVVTNNASFRNTNVVYLEEAIDGKYSSKIKNPLGSGYCDPTQSRVNIINGEAYTTLRCGEYLIDQSQFKAGDEFVVYKVSDWTDKKPKGDNVEERVLYNCVDNGKELFDTYYEDYYLVYKIYKEYNQDFHFVNAINNVCKVTSKTFYRTKDKVEQKK